MRDRFGWMDVVVSSQLQSLLRVSVDKRVKGAFECAGSIGRFCGLYPCVLSSWTRSGK